jgi:hypothetical protein
VDNNSLELVKDFINGCFVLFWLETSSKKRKSPHLASLEDAEEWWLRFQFSLHNGPERRSSVFDRRRLHAERTKRADATHFVSGMPDGRRRTDRVIQVDTDRSQASIKRYLAEQSNIRGSL